MNRIAVDKKLEKADMENRAQVAVDAHAERHPIISYNVRMVCVRGRETALARNRETVEPRGDGRPGIRESDVWSLCGE